ncbi:hypothetical protein Y1Q_0019250 [Alligator mississippiensis]|uniref:Uncharacterized protein n=1 Tax=Alligator mississippiensis TaxID=8496 RepID=A0A151MQL9_ALLMI|nr:hypothetical protein Y1Q_0019250 [Alligator mississippiensis]
MVQNPVFARFVSKHFTEFNLGLLCSTLLNLAFLNMPPHAQDLEIHHRRCSRASVCSCCQVLYVSERNCLEGPQHDLTSTPSG